MVGASAGPPKQPWCEDTVPRVRAYCAISAISQGRQGGWKESSPGGSTSSRCSLPMPPKKPKAARQSPLGFQQFTLIKKPLDVIGKQVNVLGAFWSGHKEAIVEQNGGSVMP